MKVCHCVACSSEEDVALTVTLESRSSSVGMLQGRSECEEGADRQQGLVGASQPLGTAQERFERCKKELRNHTKVLMAGLCSLHMPCHDS